MRRKCTPQKKRPGTTVLAPSLVDRKAHLVECVEVDPAQVVGPEPGGKDHRSEAGEVNGLRCPRVKPGGIRHLGGADPARRAELGDLLASFVVAGIAIVSVNPPSAAAPSEVTSTRSRTGAAKEVAYPSRWRTMSSRGMKPLGSSPAYSPPGSWTDQFGVTKQKLSQRCRRVLSAVFGGQPQPEADQDHSREAIQRGLHARPAQKA